MATHSRTTESLGALLRETDKYDELFVDGVSVIAGYGARLEVRKLTARMPQLDSVEVSSFLDRCTSPGRRMLALEWLRADPRPEALTFLARCLNQPFFLARSLAASALASIGSDAAKEALEAAYKRSADPQIRRPVEEALAQFSYPVIPTRVRRAFADARTRGTAIKALSNIASYDATDLLLEALQDADEQLSGAALEALAEREDERITPALMKMLTEGSTQTKKQAARLLSYRRGQAE